MYIWFFCNKFTFLLGEKIIIKNQVEILYFCNKTRAKITNINFSNGKLLYLMFFVYVVRYFSTNNKRKIIHPLLNQYSNNIF